MVAQVAAYCALIPPYVLVLCHFLNVALKVKPLLKHEGWLVSIFGVWVGGSSGGMLTALILGRPLEFAVTQRWYLGPAVTFSVWLIHWGPWNLGERAMNLAVVKVPFLCMGSILRTNLITSRVDAVVSAHPDNLFGQVFLGALAGCGSRFVLDGMLTALGTFEGPGEMRQPTWLSRSAVMCSLLYCALVPWAGVLTPAEGKGLIITFLVGHVIASHFAGYTLDPTAPIADIMHKFTGVEPWRPPGRGRGEKRAEPRQAAAAAGGSPSPRRRRLTGAGSPPPRARPAAAAAAAVGISSPATPASALRRTSRATAGRAPVRDV